jgi:hypothetical protein
MPTGYTAAIADGITFEQFALGCARAFGALVLMRDDPADAPIPDEFQPSDYHTKALAAARAELLRIERLTVPQARDELAAEWANTEKDRVRRLEEMADLRCKYERMLAAAKAWNAPTSEHEGMRKFMIEQIEESIRFDCGGNYYDTPAAKLELPDWLATKKANAKKDIDYHEREYAKEVERTNQRTAWVKALRASL